MTYRGRFAPSPTGELHFGSLVAAMASFLDARSRHGQWLVRIENLDPPREVKGSADLILRTLDAFGFEWDGEVMRQSQRYAIYREVVESLKGDRLAYACSCSRKEVAAVARTGIEGPVYPGSCRRGLKRDRDGRSIRLLTHDDELGFDDRVQAAVRQRLESQFGDFVIRRADGLFSYQLAVVIDDWEQGITDVVRGCDLLHSTTRQIHLQQLLDFPTPHYAHVPLAMDGSGSKLSKRDQAYPVDAGNPLPALRAALAFLGQPPAPAEIGSTDEFWNWALAHWQIGLAPNQQAAIAQFRE